MARSSMVLQHQLHGFSSCRFLLCVVVTLLFILSPLNGYPPNMPSIDTATGSMSPLPLPVNGHCQEGTVYTITSTNQLFQHISDIECIWSAAIVPNKVPLGACYGRLLAFANSMVLDWFVEFIYQGDYVLHTQCNGTYYNIGVLNFGGGGVSTGIWSVSPLPPQYTFEQGEHYDGRPGVFMDFTISVEDYCPYEGKEKAWGPLLTGFLPFTSGTWPYKLFVDMLRAVGRDEDNCLILLGRTWMRRPVPANAPLATVLYFTLKSCDPHMLPDLKRGDPMPPVAKSYDYHREGADAFFKRLNPMDYKDAEEEGTNPNGFYDYKEYLNTPEQKLLNDQPPSDGYTWESRGEPGARTRDMLKSILPSNMISNWAQMFHTLAGMWV